MTTWPADRVEKLKAGFYAGDSFAQIAAAIGGGVTRNACLGKANRLGLVRSSDKAAFHQIASKVATARHREIAGGIPGTAAERGLRAPVVHRAVGQNNGLNFMKPGAPPPAVKRRQPLFEQPGESSVPLASAHRHHCRWPFGDPETADFRFCGAPRAHGDYCDVHAKLAYVPGSSYEDLVRTFGRLA